MHLDTINSNGQAYTQTVDTEAITLQATLVKLTLAVCRKMISRTPEYLIKPVIYYMNVMD